MSKPSSGTVRRARSPRSLCALTAACMAAGAVSPHSARAVLGIYVDGDQASNAVFVNQSVGASTLYGGFLISPTINGTTSILYDGGEYGSSAVLSVIDLGYIDNTNQALTRVNTYFGDTLSSSPSNAPASGYVGTHSTDVAMFAAGLGPIDSNGNTPTDEFGMAPLATIWSGAVIAGGDPNSEVGGYTVTNQSFIDPFVQAMQTGINGVKTDVVNVSLGDSTDLVGEDWTTVALDGLIAQNHTTVVIAAGNSGPGTDTVGSPASGYNGISVGALAADPTLTYQSVADFSSRGPNDFYNPYTGVTTPGVRAAVDIVAPGDEFITQLTANTASYGSGTSYAAPLVAGGATELSSLSHELAGYFASVGYPANMTAAANDANDGRVIKAVLLNSADKLPGWNNGQMMINGVLTTRQALDFTQGAGALNLTRALTNYINGQFDPKVVGNSAPNLGAIGWDLSTVHAGTDNLYNLGEIAQGSTFTATLAWFVDRTYDSTAQIADEGSFINLNLDVYELVGGSQTLIAVSNTPYDNLQHLSFVLPDSANYAVGVNFGGIAYGPANAATPDSETYALAWSDENVAVPEPASAALLTAGIVLLRRRRSSQSVSSANSS